MVDTSPNWARVADFISIVKNGGFIFEPFINFFPECSSLQSYQYLISHNDKVEFRFLDNEDADRPHGTFSIRIHHRPSTRAVVELPHHLKSLDAARRLATLLSQDGEPEIVLSLSRLRHMICMSLHFVLLANSEMLVHLYNRFGAVPDTTKFQVSCEDMCSDHNTIALSHEKGAKNLLMPDPAFFESEGYWAHKQNILMDPVCWENRRDEAIWRGATTGSPFTAAEPLLNERIALAALCATRPDLFDVKITHIVQVTKRETEAVQDELERRGLIIKWSNFKSFAQHKIAIHIDGNASAAGLMEKLSLGCCVLKVDSAFEQWIEPDLEAWKHFVPIRADLSDLIDKTEFLRRHSELTGQIACAGFNFALSRSYREEACRFVASICSSQEWKAPEIFLTAPSPADNGVDHGQWHDAEFLPDGQGFRWTAAERVVWLDCKLQPDPRPRLISIPFLGEIVPHFAARCKIQIGEQKYPVVIDNRHITARIIISPQDINPTVALLSPTPIAPSTIRSSDDTRCLGLSLPIYS